MNRDEALKVLQKRADLVCSETYKEIANFQYKKILEWSKSSIEDKEIRGMLRLIEWTNSIPDELENFIKREKEKLNG